MASAGGAPILGAAREIVAANIKAFATHLCTVEKPALADDGHGGREQSWDDAPGMKRMPCVAYPNAAQAKVVGDVPKSHTVYSVIVRGGKNVTNSMRVRLHATEAEPERVVEIKSVLPFFGVFVEIVGLVKI